MLLQDDRGPGPHTFDYDVAIAGAGPAGSRTASRLARLGHRVVVYERDSEPGRPVHCTGIVSRECVEQYGIPPEVVLHAVHEFALRSPRGRVAQVRRRAVQAYVLDRVALDQLLARRAQDAGAVLVTSAVVDDMRWDGAGVDVRVTVDGEPRTVRARMGVVATGYGAALARRLGLTSGVPPPPDGPLSGAGRGAVHGTQFMRGTEVISGCQAVVAAHGVPQVEVFTGSAVGAGGYGWLVPWKPGYALVGVLTRSQSVRYMHELIGRLQADGRVGAVAEVFRCRAIPLGLPKRAVLDGVIGVGDVVHQVKPTSGGGIYYSLLGADAAAETVHEALATGDVTARGLASYEERWRGRMGREIRHGYALRRACEELPETVVEQMHLLLRVPGLRRVLTAASPQFDWHSGPLLRVLDHFSRAAGAGGAPPGQDGGRARTDEPLAQSL